MENLENNLDLNFDNPTAEETEYHQDLAMQIETYKKANELYDSLLEKNRARMLLGKTVHVGTVRQMREFLLGQGITRISIQGAGLVRTEEADIHSVKREYLGVIKENQRILEY